MWLFIEFVFGVVFDFLADLFIYGRGHQAVRKERRSARQRPSRRNEKGRANTDDVDNRT
ncbi:hypothetical protein [Pseudarthrobacter chlorophenolicus]|uniref:hypothetical protein n=1 Tax=Pseudarthrobacter chlorophenolicus TaxID=85085 RepID=UPI0001665AEB|nr:hypothetical protein [Pseudarthrobacter chlorophenolicus]